MKFTIFAIVLIAAGSMVLGIPIHAATAPFLESGNTGYTPQETKNMQRTGGIYECRDAKGRKVFADSTAQLADCQYLQLHKEGGEPATVAVSSFHKNPLNDDRLSGNGLIPSYSSDFYAGARDPLEESEFLYAEDPQIDPPGMSSEEPPSFMGEPQDNFPGSNDEFSPGLPNEGPSDRVPSQPISPGTGVVPFGSSQKIAGSEGKESLTNEGNLSTTITGMDLGENRSAEEVLESKENHSEGMGSCAEAEKASLSSTEFQVVRDAETERITKTVLGVVTDFREYNSRGCRQSYRVQVNGQEIYSIQYHARDDHGLIMELTETLEGITTTKFFAYDEKGQLTAVTQNGSRLTYQYDARGNRLKYEGHEGTFLSDFDANDPFRLTKYGESTYTHDANGAMVSQTTPQGSKKYSYDDEGNLTEVTQGGSTFRYQMKPEMGTVEKFRDGVLIKSFKYENHRLMSEWSDQGALVNEFWYETQENVPDYLIRAGEPFRIIPDPVGSPRLIIKATTGEIVQRLDYDSFGNVLEDTNVGFQPLGFAGGFYDRDTHLLQLEGRWYDPHSSRWITPDKNLSGAGKANPYIFKNNNPIALYF